MTRTILTALISPDVVKVNIVSGVALLISWLAPIGAVIQFLILLGTLVYTALKAYSAVKEAMKNSRRAKNSRRPCRRKNCKRRLT